LNLESFFPLNQNQIPLQGVGQVLWTRCTQVAYSLYVFYMDHVCNV
jgi:hypothetical protein